MFQDLEKLIINFSLTDPLKDLPLLHLIVVI